MTDSNTMKDSWFPVGLTRVMAVLVGLLFCAGCAADSSTPADPVTQPVDTPTSSIAPTPDADPAVTARPNPPPTPTPVIEPTAEPTPTVAPQASSGTQLLDWEEIIAAEWYTPIDVVIPSEPTWEPDKDGASIRSFERTDEGVIVDGEFVRRYPVGAMTSILTFDVDPATGYGYGFNEGVAEPGDGGCFEQLTADGGTWSRSSFDSALGDFVSDPEAWDLLALLSTPDDDRFAVRRWELIGKTPTIEGLPGGWTRQFAILDADQATKAADEFGSGRSEFDVGYFEVIAAPDGAARSTTMWVTGLGNERTADDGMSSVESTTYVTHSVIGPFQEPESRVTAQTSPQQSGCTSAIADIAGSWNLLSIIAGATEIPSSLLSQMNDASIVFGNDGQITGTTGCQDFAGTVNIDFDVLRDVDLSFTGEPCAAGDFDQDELETLFLAALTDSHRAVIDLEGRLFLVVEVDGAQLVVAFQRA